MMLQVRDFICIAKEAVQNMGSNAATIAQAVSQEVPDVAEEEDNSCVICLDRPSTVTLWPCSHNVTCGVCANMVMDAKQACPLCRSPVISING